MTAPSLALAQASIAGIVRDTAPLGAAEGVRGGNVTRVVSDLRGAAAFYLYVLGLDVRTSGGAPYPWGTDPWPRAPRVALAAIPGARWALELVELPDPSPTPFRPRMHDPGAMTLILFVRDLDAILTRARQAGAPVVTVGGDVVRVGANGALRAATIQAPDGEFIELLEGMTIPARDGAAPSAQSANVLRGSLRFTVSDVERTVRAYGDLFGLTFRGGPVFDLGVPAMLGFRNVHLRLHSTQLPGSELTFEFLEVGGLERASTRPRTVDAGTSYLYMRVPSVDTVLHRAQDATLGTVVARAKGADAGAWAGLLDANNVFLMLQEPP